jgi:hypothetical protein
MELFGNPIISKIIFKHLTSPMDLATIKFVCNLKEQVKEYEESHCYDLLEKLYKLPFVFSYSVISMGRVGYYLHCRLKIELENLHLDQRKHTITCTVDYPHLYLTEEAKYLIYLFHLHRKYHWNRCSRCRERDFRRIVWVELKICINGRTAPISKVLNIPPGNYPPSCTRFNKELNKIE